MVSAANFATQAQAGNVLGVLQVAILQGSLYAIGTAWATATRAIVVLAVGESHRVAWAGELLAALLTTLLGAGVAIAVMRRA